MDAFPLTFEGGRPGQPFINHRREAGVRIRWPISRRTAIGGDRLKRLSGRATPAIGGVILAVFSAVSITLAEERNPPMRQRPQIDRSPFAPNPTADSGLESRYLPTAAAAGFSKQSSDLLERARRELSVGAHASAEASAWQAIGVAAEAIDVGRGRGNDRVENFAAAGSRGFGKPGSMSGSAVGAVQAARVAILEARSFAPLIGGDSPPAIRGRIRSHRTPILQADTRRQNDRANSHEHPDERLSAGEAIDRYLDYARIRLAPVAAAHTDAAEAMDLLAAVYLRRDDPKTLPGPTALCLRRAAFQGQSDNASLALRLGQHLRVSGLSGEAEWVLTHALRRDPSAAVAEELARVFDRQNRPGDAERLRQWTRSSSFPRETNGDGLPVAAVETWTPAEFAAISPRLDPGGRPKSATRPAAGPRMGNGAPHADPGTGTQRPHMSRGQASSRPDRERTASRENESAWPTLGEAWRRVWK